MKNLAAQARPKQAGNRSAAALTGVLAALTVLGVGHLVAALIDPAASPFYAMGASVVDHTPHALKDAAIRRFGSNDKLALFASMAAVMVVFAAILGILERRRPLGSVLLVLLGGVVLGAALQRPTATPWFAVPTLIGVAAGVLALRVLIGRVPVSGPALGGEATEGVSSADRVAGEESHPRAGSMGGGASMTGSAPRSDRDTGRDLELDGERRSGGRHPAEGGTIARTGPMGIGAAAGDDTAAGVGRADVGDVAADVGPAARNDAVAGTRRAAGGDSAATILPVASGGIGPSRSADVSSTSGTPPSGSLGGGGSRRRFLLFAAGVGAVAVGAAVAGQWVGARLRDVVADRAGFVVPRPVVPALAVEPGVRRAVPGLAEFVTPNDRFYRVDTALQLPALRSGDWRLRIHGMVDRPMELDIVGLRRRVAVERMITMTCVSNEVGGELVGTAVWTGYLLADLLAEVGVRPEADMLLSRSVDGFTAGTPVSAVTDGRDALLAVGMNGEPLPIAHGYPARLIVPGLYGYVSATKWVVDLELTRFDRAEAYWTQRGWAAKALIKTASRIDVPAAFATVPSGDVTVAGVAWAQHRGIDAVEVQVDDQPWQPATLADEYSTDTWRQWTWRWTAPPGAHTLRVRAIDRDGVTQTDARAQPFPDGSTGWHSRVITVR
ncbi:molybdopterin-dependent oxidoreductase [Nocardia sp. NBC_01499]|uniref:molybdopterin-dependent oxidoreductase n=1 Tax=Nocardia sp. NBC_01499 TaxID=2903597 RepID=UPI003863E420